jgi:NADH-quinone oxidoreductase subunit M
MQRVFYGQAVKNDHHEIHDLSLREKLMLVPLVLVIVWLGFFPQPVLDTSKVPINNVLQSTTVKLPVDKVALDEQQKGVTHE